MIEADKLINQTVIHKSFGKGIICSVDEKYLVVDFRKKCKLSKFAYPLCFHGFLILEDSQLQLEVEKAVEVWKQESGIVQKEELKRQYEKTMQGIEARRIATEEKRLKTSRRAMGYNFISDNVKQEQKN